VLADLALESEAATALALRLARAFDAGNDTADAALARLATPALKFWICKRAPAVVAEAMEVLGGNGYVEESALPRLYREAPLNSIWEGSGNVMCLDVQRAAQREPAAVDALLAELAHARGGDVRLDRHVDALKAMFAGGSNETDARAQAGSIALALAAALLVRHAPPAVADAFCASRLVNGNLGVFGALPTGVDHDTIIARALEG
jgi:putative acyl-CoA dehydrogenase